MNNETRQSGKKDIDKIRNEIEKKYAKLIEDFKDLSEKQSLIIEQYRRKLKGK